MESTTEQQIDELELRMLRLEAAYREAAERRNRLQRASNSPQYLTPAQLAARTKQTAFMDMRPRG